MKFHCGDIGCFPVMQLKCHSAAVRSKSPQAMVSNVLGLDSTIQTKDGLGETCQ